MPQPICFSDGTYYACSRYPEIVSALEDFPSVCTISKTSFQFNVVGVICLDSFPIVVFPKNYRCITEGESYILESRNLIKALLRYRNEVSQSEDETELLFGGGRLNGSRIASALFLLEDYCQNGFIQRKSEISTSNQSGRIGWTATVNKQIPIFSHHQPVYTTPIIRKHTIDNNSIVHLAHKFVICECFKEWGWLFDYDSNVTLSFKLPFPIPEVVRELKIELRKTYLSREIKVIKGLIQYLSDTYGTDSSEKLDIIATPYFSFVWEAICGYLFDNQYSVLKALLPQPVWESDLVKGEISQRPDIFFTKGNALYILDAKYYNYTHNIPGWHDVVKQLFYRHTMLSIQNTREFMHKLPNTNTIYNAFLFPGNSDDCLYVGKVRVPGVDSLGEIIAIAINQEKAISAYAHRDVYGFPGNVQKALIQVFKPTVAT